MGEAYGRKLVMPDGADMHAQAGSGEPIDALLVAGDVEFDGPVTLSANDASGTIKVDLENVDPSTGFSQGVPFFYPQGVPLPHRVVKVYQTGTTATGIVASHNEKASLITPP